MRLVLVFLLSFFCSCDNNKSKLESYIRLEEFANGQFNKVSALHESVKLWIENSKKLRLENTKSFMFEPDYSIDKLLLVNRKENKLVGIINAPKIIWNNVKYDSIFMFWGVKINEKWYFTRGGSLHVPRENYKYNIYEPLTHWQLSYIGRDYFLKHFLTIDGDRISVNSDAIDEHVSIVDNYKIKEDSDENWLKFFEERYTKKVPQAEIDDIHKSIVEEVKEDHTLPEKGTKAYKKLYGNKTPLFEREEWKAYEAQLKKQN